MIFYVYDYIANVSTVTLKYKYINDVRLRLRNELLTKERSFAGQIDKVSPLGIKNRQEQQSKGRARLPNI